MQILAYIDPGGGAIILQVILSVVIGAWIFFRRQLSVAFSFIFRRDNKDQSKEVAPTTKE